MKCATLAERNRARSVRLILKFCVAIGGMFIAIGSVALHADDLRDQFGTTSLRAANALDRGIKLVQAQQPREALEPLAEALKEDPDLHLGYMWKAMALGDMGKIDEAVAVYTELEKAGRRTGASSPVVQGCINCGLMLGPVGRQDDAAQWFSKALLFDPEDSYGVAWLAYRNMAIGHRERGNKFAAAICMYKAFEAAPKKVKREGVDQFLQEAESEEGGNVLCLPDQRPNVTPPKDKKFRLQEVDQGAEGVSVAISQLLLEPQRNLMIAIAAEHDSYFVYEYQKENKPLTVQAPGKVSAGSMAEGRLFLALEQPPRLIEVDIKSGRQLKSWDMQTVARGIAVVPRHGVAYYSAGDELRMLDLTTRAETKTGLASSGVHDDPRQQCVYNFVRPERNGPVGGHIIINGRPVFLEAGGPTDWSQSTIHRYAVMGRQRLLAGLRINAASNGRRLHVSPDGHWMLLVGGGGWRPQQNDRGAGYGVAVLAADDPGYVQGYFAVDAYPTGAAINPVTSHIVVLRESDARVYHLSDTKQHEKLAGPFQGAAQWSGDGHFLYLAGKKGLKVYRIECDAELLKQGKNWYVNLAQPLPVPPNVSRAATVPEPLPRLKEFAPTDDAEVVRQALIEAKKLDRQIRPINWQSYEPYRRDAAFDAELIKIFKEINPDKRGPFIYRLQKLEVKVPQHPVVDHLLGVMSYCNHDFDDAVARLTRAIRADQGRTNISAESLRCLAHLFRKQKKPTSGAYCYALNLTLDPYRTEFLDEGEKFFKAEEFAAAAKPLYAMGRGKTPPPAAPGGQQRDTGLPALKLMKPGKKLSPEQIFRQAAPGVVTIKTNSGSGSGFCVGQRSLIVTNQHVVEFVRGGVEVVAYRQDGKKLVALPPVAARVVYQSQDSDLAVLRLEDPPASLEPLSVAAETPDVGARMFALGSPGLGDQVLVQSYSDGILSATQRRIEGQIYLQHTAAINPGNSGGPLLNEYGQVVGIVTMKARLENVGFAISANRLQEIFGGAKSP